MAQPFLKAQLDCAARAAYRTDATLCTAVGLALVLGSVLHGDALNLGSILVHAAPDVQLSCLP